MSRPPLIAVEGLGNIVGRQLAAGTGPTMTMGSATETISRDWLSGGATIAAHDPLWRAGSASTRLSLLTPGRTSTVAATVVDAEIRGMTVLHSNSACTSINRATPTAHHRPVRAPWNVTAADPSGQRGGK